MALTKDERTVLRLARDRIANGAEFHAFLCNNIYFVTEKAPHLKQAGARLQQYIIKQLSGHQTLESWQRSRARKHVSMGKKLDRMAWIDWMLEEK